MTNVAHSPLAEAADAVLELGAGFEEAVPASKTFSALCVPVVGALLYWNRGRRELDAGD